MERERRRIAIRLWPRLGIEMRMVQVVLTTGLASSASEAKRLIQQGGVKIDDQRVDDPYRTLTIRPGDQFLVTGWVSTRAQTGSVRVRDVTNGAEESARS